MRSTGLSRVLEGLGGAESLTKQLSAVQEQVRSAMAFDASALLRDATVASSLSAQIAQMQAQALKSSSMLDVSRVLEGLGGAESLTKQLSAVQEQVRSAMAFDASALLRDATVASSLSAQIAQMQANVSGFLGFEVATLARDVETGRLEAALESGDLTELEASLPKGLEVEHAEVPALAAAVLAAAALLYLTATLSHVAAAAAESGLGTARLLLQAIDAAHASSPELRGLLLLLEVVSVIKTLQGRS